jgi:hypothetical protein
MDEASRNTQYKLQSWQMIDAQIVAVSKGHEDPHLDIATSIALNWIETFIFNRTKKGFIWYDMAVGQRATKIAYLTRRALADGAGSEVLLPLIIAADTHRIVPDGGITFSRGVTTIPPPFSKGAGDCRP